MSPRDSNPTQHHNNDLKKEIAAEEIMTWDGSIRDEASRHINLQDDAQRTLPFMQMPLYTMICPCTVDSLSRLTVLQLLYLTTFS